MEAFLASLRAEASQYRKTAVKMDGTRRELNVEFEELQNSVATRVFSRRRRPPPAAKPKAVSFRPDPRRHVRENEDEQTWVTKSVPVSTRTEKTSHQIRADFRERPPNTARTRKTPICIRRMRPLVNDWFTEEDFEGNRQDEPPDLFAQSARVCKL